MGCIIFSNFQHHNCPQRTHVSNAACVNEPLIAITAGVPNQATISMYVLWFLMSVHLDNLHKYNLDQNCWKLQTQ